MKRLAIVGLGILPIACIDQTLPSRECVTDATCLRDGVPGLCLPSPVSDAMWCAFPDSSCESGRRWGGRAGDDLSRDCVLPTPTLAVTVMKPDSGSGTVTSSPPGIDCGTTCTAAFPQGTAVTLTATADASSVFMGWSGDCEGAEACELVVDGAKTVDASFKLHGEMLWVRQIGGIGTDQGQAIAIGPDGDVVVVGGFDQSFALDGQSLDPALPGEYDFFVAKLARVDGHRLWIRRFGAPGHDRAADVAIDSTGDILLVAEFTGDASFGNVPLSSRGVDLVIAKLLGSNGDIVWATGVGGPVDELAGELGLDAVGNVYVAGSFQGSDARFGDHVLNALGSSDGFLLRCDAGSGDVDWVRHIAGTGGEQSVGVATDSSGNVVVTGFFTDTMDFGGQSLTSTQLFDIFVAHVLEILR